MPPTYINVLNMLVSLSEILSYSKYTVIQFTLTNVRFLYIDLLKSIHQKIYQNYCDIYFKVIIRENHKDFPCAIVIYSLL